MSKGTIFKNRQIEKNDSLAGKVKSNFGSLAPKLKPE